MAENSYSSAWQEGWDAAMAETLDTPPTTNPYSVGTDEYEDWLGGWFSAMSWRLKNLGG